MHVHVIVIIFRLVLDCWFLDIYLSHRGCFTGLLNNIFIFGSVPLVADNIRVLVMRHARSHALLSGDVLDHWHRVVGIGACNIKVGVPRPGTVVENATAFERDTGIVVEILLTSSN